MESRRATADEQRLLMELARIAGVADPEDWVDTMLVREMRDGGMGSLELLGSKRGSASAGVVIAKASLQFADEDGVEVIATLNADENGVPIELDIWKTDFSPLARITASFRRASE